MNQLITVALVALTAAHMYAQEDYYYPQGSAWETISLEALGWCDDEVEPLLQYLEEEGTRAFIVLHKGRIVMEHYFNDHTATSNWYWASAGKTLTAFAVGMAQQNGLLNIDNPTSDYLGEGWTSLSPEQEQAITPRHQLTMTTGFDDSGDLNCLLPECLTFLEPPGERWSYHNAPYTLLTYVVEEAANQTFNAFVSSTIGTAIGMGGLYLPIDDMRVYFSNARDMARFGHLILSNGSWGGNLVMTDAEYFQAMITPSQTINESYGYLWWLNGQPSFMVPSVPFTFPGSFLQNAPDDLVAAIGADAQLLNVVPSLDLVLIRMGSNPENSPVPFLHNDAIWEYLNSIICNEVGTVEHTTASVGVYPNPAANWVTIDWPKTTKMVTLLSADDGRIVAQFTANEHHRRYDVSHLSAGVYVVCCSDAQGALTGRMAKLVVN